MDRAELLTRSALGAVLLLAANCPAAERIYADRPNAYDVAPVAVRAVRILISATGSGSQPCIDELEVYGPQGKTNLARSEGTRPIASSCLEGYPQHAIAHVNDGEYGNARSWIAAGVQGEWCGVLFPRLLEVSRVVISRDRQGQYSDRVPTAFSIQLSADGRTWETVRQVRAKAVAGGGSAGFRGAVGAAPKPPSPQSVSAQTAAAAIADSVTARQVNAYGLENLARRPQSTASASSALSGYAIHRVEHLRDGRGGNAHSWIAGSMPAWAQIDLGALYWISHVAFGNDAAGDYTDRAAADFCIQVSDRETEDGATWRSVYSHGAREPVLGRTDFHLTPVPARRVRVAVQSTANGGLVRLDEIEVFGQQDPIPPDQVGPVAPQPGSRPVADEDARYAFFGEEHAWLKIAGRADLSERLVPYNGRVKDYPKHAGDDVLPLPSLVAAPVLDGTLDDACWQRASRGVARVAWPYDFDAGPLVTYAVDAGVHGDRLCLAVSTSRLLSAHVAVVSAGDGEGCGAVTVTRAGCEFRTFEREDRRRVKLKETRPADGAWSADLTRFEFALPLEWFPSWQETGIRIGLGMGGRHTRAEGRPVTFLPDAVSVRHGQGDEEAFAITASAADSACRLALSYGTTEREIQLQPGASQTVTVEPEPGPAGPCRDVTIAHGDQTYMLHLFRYDPLPRVASAIRGLRARLAAKGVSTGDLDRHLAELQAAPLKPREAFLARRGLQRRFFLRDPDLAPLRSVLFVQRQPFHPSHNYSVILDSPWRPGGAVCRLDIPSEAGELMPSAGRVTPLFESGSGVARTPMATHDAERIFFSYRASRDEYFRIMAMRADGGDVQQLTNGPFHDFWPCPLPDGGLAFISTRCRARFLCWRPQAFVLFRMNTDGTGIRPLSFANLSEWAPSVMRDGRIIWTRSEYLDKGADFSHTLWAIRPDGSKPELVFGNTIIQPNGYANGREVPGTREICCTLISHFGDLNGPIALVDTGKGRFSKDAITSITPEVPWPGMWPRSECFRDPVPISSEYILCSHAPRERFALYVIDRYGNRELLHLDRQVGSMCPTPFRPVDPAPVLAGLDPAAADAAEWGTMTVADVHQGISPPVPKGAVKYLRVACEVRAGLEQMPDGSYRQDHQQFQHWYAAPVDLVSGPFGWPSYVAKGTYGLVPVTPDGSAHFRVPAGKVLYLQALDKDFNELQRMRSVVQLQPGERRGCIGCHEDRRRAPTVARKTALVRKADIPDPPPWGAGTLAYEKVVQPVWDQHCVRCHGNEHPQGIDLRGTLDADRVPASYRTLIRKGLVHHLDYRYNAGGNEKAEPLTFGVVKSKLFAVLAAGHNGVKLPQADLRAVKCWVDLNCPLWPDYQFRANRPGPEVANR